MFLTLKCCVCSEFTAVIIKFNIKDDYEDFLPIDCPFCGNKEMYELEDEDDEETETDIL